MNQGRPRGKPNISMGQIEVILDMSQRGKDDSSITRSTISQAAGCSKQTVWLYQRKYNLV